MPPETEAQRVFAYKSITALKELVGSSSEHIVPQTLPNKMF